MTTFRLGESPPHRTEREWLISSHMEPKFRNFFNVDSGLQRRNFDATMLRRFRLFTATCLRMTEPFWGISTDRHCRNAISLLERFADYELSWDDFLDGYEKLPAAYVPFDNQEYASVYHTCRSGINPNTSPPIAAKTTSLAVTRLLAQGGYGLVIGAGGQVEQHQRLLCIFGNPFRPHDWSGVLWEEYSAGEVTALAQASLEDYAQRGTLDPVALAVLCDALEDRGCPSDDGALLHLRGDEAHYKGCWAVDLILGRA